MEELLQKQRLAINGIHNIWTSFKKDNKGHKSGDYVKKKLEALDSYWVECQANHDKLCTYEDRTHEYFTGNHFEEAKKNYSVVRESIQRGAIIKPVRSGRHLTEDIYGESEAGPSSLMPIPEEVSAMGKGKVTNSKLNEKLRKQASNFKAFTRALVNIDMSNIKEKWEFDDLLKTIDTRWQAIDCLHWKIDSEYESLDQSYEQAYNEHEQQYLDIKKEINRKLWSVYHRDKATPQLDIPTFNGNYQNWIPFKDLFSEAIHGNPYLSAAQKMQFLKSKIKGEPERLIQHLPISTDNYETCWEILNQRYNNKKFIFSNYMNALMSIPVMQEATSNNIKRVHDVTLECLNGIKNLGIDINTWDPILVYLLSQKLESGILNEYCTSLKEPKDLPSLKEFLNFLYNKFTSMESTLRKKEVIPKAGNSRSSFRDRRLAQTKQLFASKKSKSKKNSAPCPACNDSHGIYYCEQSKEIDPELKKKVIAQPNYCSNCLATVHKVRPAKCYFVRPLPVPVVTLPLPCHYYCESPY